MPNVTAGPNQYLLVGRRGRLENRGSAVHAWLWPGTIFVVVPGSKQEAEFAFTQETKDGIPLRFKGIIIYRVTDPVAAAALFDFRTEAGVAQITTLLTHVVLGELRHAVSHMTMVECIEGRKTTLTGVAEAALQETIHDGDGQAWGISLEVAQLSQVFIVDPELRQQLEAEIRNEIKLKSDQSNIQTTEATRLTEMASEGRVEEQKLAGEKERLRRRDELDQVELVRQRRTAAEAVETERLALALEQERFHAEMDAERDRVTAEAPIRRLRISMDADILREELGMRELRNQAQALEVEHELLLRRAEQDLRREILPLERAPQIVEAASKVLQGTNLSIYGEDGRLLGQLAPVFDILARAVAQATAASPRPVGSSKVTSDDPSDLTPADAGPASGD